MNIESFRQSEFAARKWIANNIERGHSERFTITGQYVDHILAKELLLFNHGNRPVSKTHVQTIANGIHNGEWIETGDTVKVSIQGRLIDGQHRLLAISKSNRGVKLDFAFGVEDAAQTRIDVNKVRQAGQQLSMSGMKYGFTLAPAARIIKTLQQGHINTDHTISKHALYEFCMRDEVLQQCAEEAMSLRKKLGSKSSAAGICVGLYLLKTAKVPQRIHLQAFVYALDKGVNLEEHSPILHLRNNLIRGSNARNSHVPYDVSAWFVKAFALHVRNEPCYKLQFVPSREGFPDLAKLLA